MDEVLFKRNLSCLKKEKYSAHLTHPRPLSSSVSVFSAREHVPGLDTLVQQ